MRIHEIYVVTLRKRSDLYVRYFIRLADIFKEIAVLYSIHDRTILAQFHIVDTLIICNPNLRWR